MKPPLFFEIFHKVPTIEENGHTRLWNYWAKHGNLPWYMVQRARCTNWYYRHRNHGFTGWRCNLDRHHDGPCPLRPYWWNMTKFAREYRKFERKA